MIIIFYDPYQFIKFGKDDNEENAIFYFFVLDKDKNKNLLLETKIEKHISKCGRCNLCKKYKGIGVKEKFENIDMYYIIYNNQNYLLNLINKIIRGIRIYGKNSIASNSYFLINLIYIYHIAKIHKDYCLYLNTELVYELINSENKQYFEEYKNYLDKIKFTNNFINKSKVIIETIYKVFDEKNLDKKYEFIFNLCSLLEQLKFKEIKNNMNNIGNYNSNGNSSDKTLNCGNILTICSLFYEELYNEPISNSRIYIRDSQNLLDDLINNNIKNNKLITLEITAQHFIVKIIRAGGFLNKYENYSLFDLFPEIFRKKQIIMMKKILLNSDSDFQKSKIDNNKNRNTRSKIKENEFQRINLNFIIEIKEGNDIYFQLLKLDLNFLILKTINTVFYLNGIYKIDKEIIITKQTGDLEYLFHFGNENQKKLIPEKPNENKIKIKKINGYKYLKKKKLIQDENALIECKHFRVYHFLNQTKKIKITLSKKDNINNLTDEFIEQKSFNLENNNNLIINDVASQSSSVTSSMSKNNLMSYNRGNKQIKAGEDITKNFRTLKYILWIFIIYLLIMLILEFLLLQLYHSNLSKEITFYLSLLKFYITYSRIFCSILSLSCVGISPESTECTNGIKEYSEYQMKISNITELENMEINEEYFIILFSLFYVNFEELLFNQEQIMNYILEETKESITDNLIKINKKKFNTFFEFNLTYHKINKNFDNGKINLSIKKEKISFNDFLLLITSRCGILSKDIEELRNPIYILNKFDEKDLFKNINKKDKMNPYQENFYLLLLDNYEFITYINDTISKIEEMVFNKMNFFKSYIYIIIIINVIFYFIIFLNLFFYISIYLIIIFQILKNIYAIIKKKLGEIAIKDIMRKKIDNLNMILSFYENNINNSIKDLNSIYHDYKESLNLKLKEEAKFNKKENKVLNKSEINKNSNLLKLFKLKYFRIFFSYSTKKYIYIYSITFIILLIILLFLIYVTLMILYLKRQNNAFNFIKLTEGINEATNLLMTNFLAMIFTNQTFSEISSHLPSNDLTSYLYYKLTDFYEADGYLNNIKDLLLFTEDNIEYDCNKFYENWISPFLIYYWTNIN